MTGVGLVHVLEVTVSGADCDEPEDAPAALPPFALTLASIPRRRHSWICRCVFHTMTGVGLVHVLEVTVSGADCDEPEDAPAALPPFALTLASIPRRRHSWICRCVFHTMTGVGLVHVLEVTVSGADCDEPEDAPAALPPFALTLASIPRRRHSWICRCVFHTMTGSGLVHVLEVTVSGADCDEPEDAPAALPPFALPSLDVDTLGYAGDIINVFFYIFASKLFFGFVGMTYLPW
ncbi:hypothetical protein O0L34_g17578 [Tuta absoluta]|nr:hypothetical protein O0L34_g17578 [Tuta absoluta]